MSRGNKRGAHTAHDGNLANAYLISGRLRRGLEKATYPNTPGEWHLAGSSGWRGGRDVPIDVKKVEEAAEPGDEIVVDKLDAKRCVCCL